MNKLLSKYISTEQTSFYYSEKKLREKKLVREKHENLNKSVIVIFI